MTKKNGMVCIWEKRSAKGSGAENESAVLLLTFRDNAAVSMELLLLRNMTTFQLLLFRLYYIYPDSICSGLWNVTPRDRLREGRSRSMVSPRFLTGELEAAEEEKKKKSFFLFSFMTDASNFQAQMFLSVVTMLRGLE